MSEPRCFPFGGVPVYNPQSLSREEAIAQFHARQNVYDTLLDLLKEERPSHVLIIGTRGMGKTTLLQRLRFGVEDSPELSLRYLPLTFPEEQYNVNRLHHFLLNTLDALADILEERKDRRTLAQIEVRAAELGKAAPERIVEEAPRFLAEISGKIGRNFLLLVDNADRLFETIEDREQWRLRELLASRRDLTFFGATTEASEGIYSPDRAFFEFFRIQRLAPLTLAEVRNLLLRLGEAVEDSDRSGVSARSRIEAWIDSDPGRLRTLVQLTGGNPRTAVLLFHLALDGLEGGAREYLEQLLDQCTPNYKGRVDDLPPQAQQVLDAVALRWDPAMASEIAEITGLETGTVSTHLTRLVRQGVLEKVDPGDSRKALYQVAERFFNIWYLMRASRRVRTRLRWFVEFLRVFYDSDHLERQAWERLELFRGAGRVGQREVENLFAYASASGGDVGRFEEYLRRECADREELWAPFFASASRENQPLNRAFGGVFDGPAFGRFGELVQALNGPDKKAALLSLVTAFRDNRDMAEAVEAAARGHIESHQESAESWRALGALLSLMPDREGQAETALRRAIQLDSSDAGSWAILGTRLMEVPDRESDAEESLRRAIELGPEGRACWANLGLLLARQRGRAREAESALRNALAVNPEDARSWANLGAVLRGISGREEEAATALMKAVELDGELAGAWISLGLVLLEIDGREGDTELALKKGIELDPGSAPAWLALGRLLGSKVSGREADAEAALRRALEIEPGSAPAYTLLLVLLARNRERVHDAREAFRHCLEITPANAAMWGLYGIFLACRVKEPNGAEAAFRKSIELTPDTAVMRNLGVLLYCQLDREDEGVEFIRQACQLDGDDPVPESLARAILAACLHGSGRADNSVALPVEDLREASRWDELGDLCKEYAPFGKILHSLCVLVEKEDVDNRYAPLWRASALAQLDDFPRAIVALQDALVGDPVDLLSWGRNAVEIILAAAVRHARVGDCLEVIEKLGWIDAWRPIYEALRAVESGSADHLKRVAVEIHEPAKSILLRIAPDLPGQEPVSTGE